MVFGEHSHGVDKKDVVVDGELEFCMYGKKIVLQAGDTLVVPKNEPHSAKVIGDKKLEFFDATKLWNGAGIKNDFCLFSFVLRTLNKMALLCNALGRVIVIY